MSLFLRDTSASRNSNSACGRASLIALLLFLVGCASPSVDVTGHPRYHGGYHPGESYVLVRDAAELGSGPGSLFPVDELALEMPLRTLPSGTTLRVQRFLFVDTQVMPSYWVYLLRIHAELTSGPSAGRIVEIHGLSDTRDADLPKSLPDRGTHEVDRRLLYPAPKYLRALPEVQGPPDDRRTSTSSP